MRLSTSNCESDSFVCERRGKDIGNAFNSRKTAYVLVGLFAVAVLAANTLVYYAFLCGAICISIALLFSIVVKRSFGSIVRVQAIFCSIWMAAVGISLFRIHPLQEQWNLISTLCIAFVPALFLVGTNIGERIFETAEKKAHFLKFKGSRFVCILPEWFPTFVLGALISIGLALDLVYSGGFPVYSSDQSAYMRFGMPYIHYLTVLCSLYPGFAFVQLQDGAFKNTSLFIKIMLCIFGLVSFVTPILIVSRQLLMMECFVFAVSIVVSTSLDSRIKIIWVLIAVVLLVALWGVLSLFRNQNPAYLSEVFLLPRSNSKIEMSLWQLYLYIGFNFDNFDYLVSNYHEFTHGVSSLFPFLVLMGFGTYAKGVVGAVELPMKLPTFTTRSILETPYMDASIAGVVVYIVILGIFAILLERFALLNRNSGSFVGAYSVLLYSLLISFFVDEFALPVFWVYLIVLALLQLISGFCETSKGKGVK